MAILRDFNASTRFRWALWRRLLPAPAKRLNATVSALSSLKLVRKLMIAVVKYNQSHLAIAFNSTETHLE